MSRLWERVYKPFLDVCCAEICQPLIFLTHLLIVILGDASIAVSEIIGHTVEQVPLDDNILPAVRD